jgi:hypothetical protein
MRLTGTEMFMLFKYLFYAARNFPLTPVFQLKVSNSAQLFERPAQ